MKEKFNSNLWSLCIVALLITILTEAMGKTTLQMGIITVVFFPMLYAVIMGILITPDILGKYFTKLKKIIGEKEINIAGDIVGISLIILGIRYGTLVGPNIDKIISSGFAFLAQELGHIIAPLLSLPLAIALGMKREAIGAATSISREPSLGVITEKYGAGSPEGNGVLGTYLVGTVVGTIFFGILGSVSIYSGIHPLALAMACGVGSGSMTTAAAGSLAAVVSPDLRESILAYAATSNMLSGITGVNFLIFVTLPLSNFIYKKLIRKKENTTN